MFTNPSKYYTRYNRNIKAIKGSGVITPRPPKDSDQTTGTVKETLVNDIQYMPPFYLRTWDNDEQNTNGYLNEKDYVDYVPEIDRYYYTTQQMDKVVVKDRKFKGPNDPDYPIKLPPPLVTTPADSYIKNNKFNKFNNINNINKINGKNNDKSFDKSNNKSNEQDILNKESEYGIGQGDINRKWYDGRYLYTLSPSSLKTVYPWTTYNLLYPFNSAADNLQYYQDSGVKNITGDPLARPNKNPINEKLVEENFDNSTDSNNDNYTTTCIQNYNILYLTILCILIVIYFVRSKK